MSELAFCTACRNYTQVIDGKCEICNAEISDEELSSCEERSLSCQDECECNGGCCCNDTPSECDHND